VAAVRPSAPPPTPKRPKPLMLSRPKAIPWIQNNKSKGLIALAVLLVVVLIIGVALAIYFLTGATSGEHVIFL